MRGRREDVAILPPVSLGFSGGGRNWSTVILLSRFTEERTEWKEMPKRGALSSGMVEEVFGCGKHGFMEHPVHNKVPASGSFLLLQQQEEHEWDCFVGPRFAAQATLAVALIGIHECTDDRGDLTIVAL